MLGWRVVKCEENSSTWQIGKSPFRIGRRNTKNTIVGNIGPAAGINKLVGLTHFQISNTSVAPVPEAANP